MKYSKLKEYTNALPYVPLIGRRSAVTLSNGYSVIVCLENANTVNLYLTNAAETLTKVSVIYPYNDNFPNKVYLFDYGGECYICANVYEGALDPATYIFSSSGGYANFNTDRGEELYKDINGLNILDFFIANSNAYILYLSGNATILRKIRMSDWTLVSNLTLAASGYIIPSTNIQLERWSFVKYYAGGDGDGSYLCHVTLAVMSVIEGSRFSATNYCADANARDGWVHFTQAKWYTGWIHCYEGAAWKTFLIAHTGLITEMINYSNGRFVPANICNENEYYLGYDTQVKCMRGNGGLITDFCTKPANITTAGGKCLAGSDKKLYIMYLSNEIEGSISQDSYSVEISDLGTIVSNQSLLIYDEKNTLLSIGLITQFTYQDATKITLECVNFISDKRKEQFEQLPYAAHMDTNLGIILTYLPGLYLDYTRSTENARFIEYKFTSKISVDSILKYVEEKTGYYSCVMPNGALIITDVGTDSGLTITPLQSPQESKKNNAIGWLTAWGKGIYSELKISNSSGTRNLYYPKVSVKADLDAILVKLAAFKDLKTAVFVAATQIGIGEKFGYVGVFADVFTGTTSVFAKQWTYSSTNDLYTITAVNLFINAKSQERKEIYDTIIESASLNGDQTIAGVKTFSSFPVKSTMSNFKVSSNFARTFPAGTYTLMYWEIETYDNCNEFNNTNGQDKFTAANSGTYHFGGQFLMESRAYTAGHIYELAVYKNGALFQYLIRWTVEASITEYKQMLFNFVIDLAANDYIQLYYVSGVGTSYLHNNAAHNIWWGYRVK